MRQTVSCLCYMVVTTLTCLATETTTEDKTSVSSASLPTINCTKEELMTFFPAPVVRFILVKAQIPQQQADSIAQELSQKDRELVKKVEEKAAKLNPNPFKDLSQRDLAVKIYRETLYEIFASVLKSHGITDDDKIQSLLDEMQMTKSKLFIECIRKEQTASFRAPSPSPSSPSF